MSRVAPADGRLESASDGVVLGWVGQPEDGAPVLVQVLVDGELVASAVADLARPDLPAAPGVAPVRGFAVALPDELVETGDHVLRVVVLPGGQALPAEPDFDGSTEDGVWCTTAFTVGAQVTQTPTPAPAAEAEAAPPETAPASPAPADTSGDTSAPPGLPEIRFLVESVAGGVVSGWLRSRRHPPREIVVLRDGVEVARGPADIGRPDLERHCRGFRIELPDWLRHGGPHALSVQLGDEVLPIAPGGLLPTVVTATSARAPDVRLVQLEVGAQEQDARRAHVGRDGWLFPERTGDAAWWDEELTPEQLQAAVAVIRGWSQAYLLLGIPAVLAVLPARERLERVQLDPQATPPRERSPLVQLRQALLEVDDAELLELLPALEAARQAEAVSWRTDASLSARGAFFAARALLKEAAKRAAPVSPPPMADLVLRPATSLRGDLAGLAKLGWIDGRLQALELGDTPLASFGEQGELPPPGTFVAHPAPVGRHLAAIAGQVRVLERPDAPGGRAILLGARLPSTLPLWLADRLRRLTVIEGSRPSLAEIELELPDLVLHVIAEEDLRLLR